MTPCPLRLPRFERRAKSVRLPLFMPVYQPRSPTFRLALWQSDPPIDACIVNAFFLYKQRDIRKALLATASLHDHIGAATCAIPVPIVPAPITLNFGIILL